MPCDEYVRLEATRKRASERYFQFSNEKYSSLRGTSKTDAKRRANEAHKEMILLDERLQQHMQTCTLCMPI